jgi:hypothetical protein
MSSTPFVRVAFLGIVLAALAGEARGDEPAGFSYALFNGQNLEGWRVTGCETAVEDGALVLKQGEGFVRTDHRYSDFILEIDWKPLKAEKWDSGIYIRSELPPTGKHWPQRYQVNLLAGGEGNLLGIKGATSTGLVKPGDWNRFKLTVIGPKAELEINGQPAWKAEGLEPKTGYIGIQSEVTQGGSFAFKNIKITELGYKSLFNGKDLSGWEGGGSDAAKCWQVEDGLLICTGAKGPWLRSKEQYGDFNVRLEYKLKPGGNSGVFCRVPADGKHHGPGSGVEIQLLDDKHEKYKTLKSWQYTGSVYDIAPAKEHVGREAGQWNTIEIDCKGLAYRITHNGVIVVDAQEAEFPLLKERITSGYLGLQNHSEHVWFRNVRVGPSAY